MLKEFFLKPFREKEENYYQFVHEADLEFHSLSNLVASVFNDPRQSHEISVEIAKLLYEQSSHPHIKPGEVYVAHIENVMMDNEKMDNEKLVTAILTQAVEDAKYIGLNKKYLKHKIEAINWIMSGDPQFKYYCKLLNIEPSYIQNKIKNDTTITSQQKMLLKPIVEVKS